MLFRFVGEGRKDRTGRQGGQQGTTRKGSGEPLLQVSSWRREAFLGFQVHSPVKTITLVAWQPSAPGEGLANFSGIPDSACLQEAKGPPNHYRRSSVHPSDLLPA